MTWLALPHEWRAAWQIKSSSKISSLDTPALKERKQLRAEGYVYDRQLGQWIHHSAQKRYYKQKEEAEQFALFIGYGVAAVLFVWMFVAIAEQG